MTAEVLPISPQQAAHVVIAEHYLHREPGITAAYGLFDDGILRGVVTYGIPASRNLQQSACPANPDAVVELNRLWVDDVMPRNTESWFVARSLRLLPPRIVVSYADPQHGHYGYIYRALNFRYAGWTDMDRKTPRLDYIPHNAAQHTREAMRSGYSHTVRRVPKVRYWTVTGTRREQRQLNAACGWPSLDWKTQPPPEVDGAQVIRDQPPVRASAAALLF